MIVLTSIALLPPFITFRPPCPSHSHSLSFHSSGAPFASIEIMDDYQPCTVPLSYSCVCLLLMFACVYFLHRCSYILCCILSPPSPLPPTVTNLFLPLILSHLPIYSSALPIGII